MPGEYVLYGGGVTRAVAVELVLRELELPYELVEIDLSHAQHRAPEFLRINPSGYLPALVTPAGEVLHENAAILLWLAETHESEELAPAVHDASRGRFLSKLFFHSNDIQPAMKRYFYASRYAPEPASVDAVRAQAREVALERWGVLNQYLETHGPYHLGRRFSLLDIHIAVWAVYGLDYTDQILDRFAAVRRCYDLTGQRPRIGGSILSFRQEVTSRMGSR